VKYDEITQMVTSSSAGDWTVLQPGPLYLDELGEVSSGDRHWVEVNTHYSMAVYRPDVNLRLAWGLKRDDDQHFEGWSWPNPKITRSLADAFWQGSLVARWSYLVVDGGACYLPDPDREILRTGDSPTDIEWGRRTAQASEVALARLLNAFAQRPYEQFDRYFEQSGIVEVPDEQGDGSRHRILE
jgi:hypothetical protein